MSLVVYWQARTPRQVEVDEEVRGDDGLRALGAPGIAGLGARGLVYHSLFARWLAAAVLAGDPAGLPPECSAWRRRFFDDAPPGATPG